MRRHSGAVILTTFAAIVTCLVLFSLIRLDADPSATTSFVVQSHWDRHQGLGSAAKYLHSDTQVDRCCVFLAGGRSCFKLTRRGRLVVKSVKFMSQSQEAVCRENARPIFEGATRLTSELSYLCLTLHAVCCFRIARSHQGFELLSRLRAWRRPVAA